MSSQANFKLLTLFSEIWRNNCINCLIAYLIFCYFIDTSNFTAGFASLLHGFPRLAKTIYTKSLD
jgi:hypothetical protein